MPIEIKDIGNLKGNLMNDAMEIHEASRYALNQVDDALKEIMRCEANIFRSLNIISKESINPSDFLTIFKALHQSQQRLIMSNQKLSEAKEQLESWVCS